MSQGISIDIVVGIIVISMYGTIQITLYNCFNAMNTKMKQFSRTGTDLLKVYVYWTTKWNMKEIGKINNRHKTQSTEGINFYRQEENAKGKKRTNTLAKN